MRPLAALACLALILLAAGCGGGGSASEDEAEPGTTTQPLATGTGGTTKPGTALKLGETAHVKFKSYSAAAGTNAKTYPLDVTVLKIEKGSIDDFENVNLDEAQKKSTPYYVSVRVSNPGAEVPVKNDDPVYRVDAIDDRGQEQGSVTFIGEFERCEDKDPPTPFTDGKSYETCLAYLMPGGGSIVQVNWSGSDEYALKPVTWK